jgi:uncharacterized protein
MPSYPGQIYAQRRAKGPVSAGLCNARLPYRNPSLICTPDPKHFRNIFGAGSPRFAGPQPVADARRNGPALDVAPDRIGVRPEVRDLSAARLREREMSGYATDHAGLEILPFERCLQLLATVPVGRVSFLADGEIVVLPVNHVIDGQDPVFCTAIGSTLSAAGEHDLMAFEADEYDKRTRSGWSVLVSGRAHLGLHPWVAGVDRPFWIRIRPASISGRQTPGAS